MKKFLISAAAVVACATVTSTAMAQTVRFNVIGGTALDSYQFTVAQTPAPTDVTAHGFSLYDVESFGDIGFGAVDYLASYSFSDDGQGGGFAGGYALNVYSGPALFSGSSAAPTFNTGRYTLTDYFGQATVVTVTSVPEPATWLLVGLAFAGVGSAIRRRRTHPQIV